MTGLAGCGGGDGGDGGDGGSDGGDGGSDGGDGGSDGGDGGSDGGDGGSGETATFWAWNDPGLTPIREDQAAEFAEMHDNVSDASFENFPFENYLSQVTNSVSAGTAPDAAALSVLWTPRMIDQGVATPVTEFDINPDDFVGAGRNNSSYDGTMGTVPWYVDCRMIGINRGQFEEAGLEVPDRTYRPTFEEFGGWIDTLSSELDSGRGFSMPAGEGFDGFVLSNGGGYINDDASEAIINNDAAVEAAEFLQPMVVDDESVIARPTGATDTGIDDFLSGNAPMFYAGSWQVPRLQDSDIDWQFIPFPSGPQLSDDVSHTWSAGVFYMAPQRGGANQEIGQQWLEYIASEEVQAKVTDQMGGFPALQSAYETDTFQSTIEEEPRLETVEQEIENTKAFPSHPEVPTMWNTVHTQAEALWQGDDIQTVLDRAASEINNVL